MKLSELTHHIPHKFKPEDEKALKAALDFAVSAHGDQKRKSGEDFISHPVNAAIILGQIFPDVTTLVATVLHDITEDTKVTDEELTKVFGGEIARLVDGVTKLGHVRLLNSKDEYYVENLRKMFIATSKDVRVLLIKLADRLHNMRTIKFLPPEKQLKVATETLEMYAPIAGRLGIGAWKDELEDLAFEIVNPKDFEATKKLLEDELNQREENLKEIKKSIDHALRNTGVKFLEINGRVKRIYALWKKLKRYSEDITKIYDIVAFRVITKSTADCYAALGGIHKFFQPVPGRIKDYISLPKPNGYQSLHTTVFDKHSKIFEVQIRTDLMDEEAERGIAAHWFYTEQNKSDNLERMQTKWISELHSWQEATSDPDEYLENLKIDFFQDRIFVCTPKGDVKDLPRGATAIDFAFAVHSDLGYYMMGAKINGKMASIYSELKQGNMVEVLKTKQPVKISRDWLDAAKTSHARSQIRHYLRENDKGLFERIRELKLESIGLPTFFKRK